MYYQNLSKTQKHHSLLLLVLPPTIKETPYIAATVCLKNKGLLPLNTNHGLDPLIKIVSLFYLLFKKIILCGPLRSVPPNSFIT